MRMLVGVIPLLWLAPGCQARGQSSSNPPPIIDMNLKAHSLSQYGGGMPNCANNQEILYPGADPREPMILARLKTCPSPIPPAANDESLMKESLATLERHNIFAVTTGPLAHVRAWRAAAPDRIIPAHAFGDPGSPSVEEFRRLFANRELALFAEVSPQYEGVTLGRPEMGALLRARRGARHPRRRPSRGGPPWWPLLGSAKLSRAVDEPSAAGRSADSPPEASTVCHPLRLPAG